MAESYPDTLALSRKVLRVLIVLNLTMGACILALLIASLIAGSWVMTALGIPPGGADATVRLGMRMIMLIGISAVPVVNFVLTRLLTIVDTVAVGDPFVSLNARRLSLIAWAVLILEIMHIAVGLVLAAISTPSSHIHVGWEFSVTRWVAILMLFVLARVFEQGARMREDLEGTV